LFGLSGAGFMMIDDRNALRSVVTTDGAGEALEETQRDTGEGPCVDAFVTNATIRSSDLPRDSRYRRVGPRLGERGVHAVLGVPIRLGGGPVGALNVYVDQPHEWTGEEVAGLEVYGQLLEGLLTAVLTAERHGQLARQLQYALDYRVVIERAVGYLMASHDADAVEAFNRLRTAARDQRRRVADLAADVLNRRILL
ncbi:MAG TPA: GAF and ANTAR domain-containing protein, partial [Acidimicrobiales bacterium]|nr:GAF and ANTAR domain-containing protein [Acidimicrobiales bacterium]